MEHRTSELNSKRQNVLCMVVLFSACFLVGLFCCELNRQFYRHHHPFYDSLSYNEKMFRVMTISRESGFAASLETACFTNNTNCLPFLVGAAIAPLISPSRLVGVWIQTGLLYLFLVSLLFYLIRIRNLKPATALAGCLAFLTVKCLFFSNGGLSDFRMDLSLYLGFGMTCLWYLATMARPTVTNALLLGVSAAIVCLFRATAPIYLLFSLAPLAVIEVLAHDQRRKKLIGLTLATVTVIILSGWFFVINFEFLKFYYVDWNTDANAKIPFVDALRHWKLAQRSVGEATTLLILSCVIGIMLLTRRHESVSKWISRAWSNREIDWRIGWLALSPVVLMVARRAGLNPFVCMPAVFGLVLFFVLPCLSQIDRLANKRLNRFCCVMLLACLSIAIARGWKRHSRVGFDTRNAQNQLIDTMLEDSLGRNVSGFSFGVVHLTDLNSNSLYSTLLFDRVDATPKLTSVEIKGLEIKRIATFSQPAAENWRILPGETNAEKIAHMVSDANARIDYLILPDQRCTEELQTTAAHNFINRFLVPIRQQIVNDDSWTVVGKPIATNDVESVEIFRKVR